MPTDTITTAATSEETQLLGRVAAGDHGRPLVELYSLYSARLYGLAVTAEPGDGDPAPHGPDVLRSRPEVPLQPTLT